MLCGLSTACSPALLCIPPPQHGTPADCKVTNSSNLFDKVIYAHAKMQGCVLLLALRPAGQQATDDSKRA